MDTGTILIIGIYSIGCLFGLALVSPPFIIAAVVMKSYKSYEATNRHKADATVTNQAVKSQGEIAAAKARFEAQKQIEKAKALHAKHILEIELETKKELAILAQKAKADSEEAKRKHDLEILRIKSKEKKEDKKEDHNRKLAVIALEQANKERLNQQKNQQNQPAKQKPIIYLDLNTLAKLTPSQALGREIDSIVDSHDRIIITIK